MRRLRIGIMCCLCVLLCTVLCEAEIRAPGKYCGVVIFDRWDGCILYDAVYVSYISEKTKEGLREHAGQVVLIDAKKVYQPINPGDGRIDQFEYLGTAPEERNFTQLKGIHLESSINVSESGKAVATITIENREKEPAELFSRELALTLLIKIPTSERKISAADGPSIAFITRQSFEIDDSSPRWQSHGMKEGKPYSWTIGKENALPHTFTLAPGERKQINVQFDLPDGEYDFLCGYGMSSQESACLASNLSAFNVEEGEAKVIEMKDR
ncbi:MAG: hypothetical protein JXR23_07605 [Pontiellaceae bacterium]|nr:hypothetical protein [Pontiellaceae bacterium]